MVLKMFYHFRLVYIVCQDDDGRFQSPPDMDNSTEMAIKKIKVAGEKWFTFIVH